VTADELKQLLDLAEGCGSDSIALVMSGKYPKGFPRGELLCENSARERVYRFKVASLRRLL
jgi:hypothetical protein